jgi:hypothetical protein
MASNSEYEQRQLFEKKLSWLEAAELNSLNSFYKSMEDFVFSVDYSEYDKIFNIELTNKNK